MTFQEEDGYMKLQKTTLLQISAVTTDTLHKCAEGLFRFLSTL